VYRRMLRRWLRKVELPDQERGLKLSEMTTKK